MRYILIDRLLELEPGVRAVAEYCFSPDNEIFEDHFPGCPIVPGALMAESMGQTGGWLVAATVDFARRPLLTMIDNAKFATLVSPGDHIRIEAILRSTRGDDFEVMSKATVDGRRVAGARLLFHAFDEASMPAASQFEAWARDTFRALGGDDLLRARTGVDTTP